MSLPGSLGVWVRLVVSIYFIATTHHCVARGIYTQLHLSLIRTQTKSFQFSKQLSSSACIDQCWLLFRAVLVGEACLVYVHIGGQRLMSSWRKILCAEIYWCSACLSIHQRCLIEITSCKSQPVPCQIGM